MKEDVLLIDYDGNIYENMIITIDDNVIFEEKVGDRKLILTAEQFRLRNIRPKFISKIKHEQYISEKS